MKIFYDLRLGYLVSFPGSDSALTELIAKSGDEEEVILQFGRSADPTGSSSLIESPEWTPENLIGGSVITAALKLADVYSDGDLLASNSTWTHDAGEYTYTGALNLNTTAINDALERLDADDENDIAEIECGFEVTIQIGGVGGWRSSVLPVTFTIYHDIIAGDEATPVNADDPDEYVLKGAVIEWLPTVSSKTGGTAADLDALITAGVTVGKSVQFVDEDAVPALLRQYKLYAGTDAEDSPTVIRPDDYDGATNAKVWKLLEVQDGISEIVEDSTPQLGGNLDANGNNIAFDSNTGILDENGNEQLLFETTASAVNYATLKNAATGSGPFLSAKGSDTNVDLNLAAKGTGEIKAGSIINANGKLVKLAKGANVASAATLTLGNDGNQFDVTGTTTITAIATKGIGTQVKLRFAGALILTHNATTLVLPSGANITTAAGDEAEFIEYGTGNWRCTNYQRASGRALIVSAPTGIPDGYVDATSNRDLINSTDNGKFIAVSGSATTMTIDRQSTGGWTDGAHFWVCNRKSSGDVTVSPDGTVTLIRSGTTSQSVVIGAGDRAAHFWRQSENFWFVIS